MLRASKAKTPVLDCGVCILAGGLSRRMGRDKASLRLGSRTLLGHIRVNAKKTGLKVRTIRRDLIERCGPLGGIYTALKTSKHQAEIFLACDMPFVSAETLQTLLRVWGNNGRPVFTLPSAGARAGFPFLLPVNSVNEVQQQISRKEFSLRELARALDASHITTKPRRDWELENVNTPAEWRRAKERFAADSTNNSA